MSLLLKFRCSSVNCNIFDENKIQMLIARRSSWNDSECFYYLFIILQYYSAEINAYYV